MLKLKPPRPYFPPKPRRLPERKHMTIALGMTSIGGFVLATDSQETFGPFKTDQRKIISTQVRRYGYSAACAVAGAGHAAYIEAFSRHLLDVFNAEKFGVDEWRDRLELELRA